jgi:FixJ family two-component response regulator
MKVLKEINEKYYPDVEDVKAIIICGIKRKDIAKQMNISYMTFHRKLYRKDGRYFTRMEVDKLHEITGLIFDFH